MDSLIRYARRLPIGELLLGAVGVVLMWRFLPWPLQPVGVVLFLGGDAALLAFYWPHCARPALYSVGATSRTMRVVPVVGLVAWLTFAAAATLRVRDLWPVLEVLLVLSTAWYGAAWPAPKLVARISGGRVPLEGVRRVVWSLRWSVGQLVLRPDRPAERKAATAWRNLLVRSDRPRGSERLVALWLAESEDVLAGGKTDGARSAEIEAEAKRLWPHGDDWRVTIPPDYGAVNREGLRQAYLTIADAARRPDPTGKRMAGIMRDVDRLALFRAEDTDEFIDLSQAEFREWETQGNAESNERRARFERLIQAGDRLWAPAAEPKASA